MSFFKLVWQLTHSFSAAISLLIEVFGVRTIKRGKKKTTAKTNLFFAFNLATSLQLTRIKDYET